MDKPRLYVGVDWATEEHAVCALAPDGAVVAERSFKHSGDGLAELVAWLEKLADGEVSEVAVSIEIPHGAVVETLLERGCCVFSINPKQLDRFRDRFSLAGAKDDRRDAYVLADSLRTDQHCFRRLQVADPLVLELREWSRAHDEIGRDRVRLTNQLREQLRRYFPQYIELADSSIGDDWFLELWNRIPTPAETKRVRAVTVQRILRKHRIRRVDGARVLECLRQTPLTVAPGTEKAAVARIRLLADRLAVVNRQARQCVHNLESLVEQIGSQGAPEEGPAERNEQRSDTEILRSLPGVGTIILATLLSEAPDAVRSRDYHTLRSLSGVAPVTVSSGKSRRVLMRKACHPRLRTACYHWARVAAQRDQASRLIYSRLRERGHSHGRALRTLADQLLSIACSMLRSRTLYDPARRANAKASA